MRCSQVAKYLQSNPTCHSVVPCRVRTQWKKKKKPKKLLYFDFFWCCCVKRKCLVYFWLMPRKQVMYGFLNCTVLIFKGRDDNFLESPEARRAAFSPFWGSWHFFCSTTRGCTHFQNTGMKMATLAELFLGEKWSQQKEEWNWKGGNHWPFSLPMAWLFPGDLPREWRGDSSSQIKESLLLTVEVCTM